MNPRSGTQRACRGVVPAGRASSGRRPRTGLGTWLLARQGGRWAAARGRWVQTVMTAGLVLIGLSAWALALVQPWTGRTGDYGVVSVTGGLDTDKIRAAAADIERICGPETPAAPRPLRRNPFAGPGAVPVSSVPGAVAVPPGSAAETPAEPPALGGQDPKPSEPVAEKPGLPRHRPDEPGGPPSATAVLETVRSLRLEITLIPPSGERWAVINGQNYREGDAIAGLEIIEIQEGKVKLQQGGITCLLRMD